MKILINVLKMMSLKCQYGQKINLLRSIVTIIRYGQKQMYNSMQIQISLFQSNSAFSSIQADSPCQGQFPNINYAKTHPKLMFQKQYLKSSKYFVKNYLCPFKMVLMVESLQAKTFGHIEINIQIIFLLQNLWLNRFQFYDYYKIQYTFKERMLCSQNKQNAQRSKEEIKIKRRKQSKDLDQDFNPSQRKNLRKNIDKKNKNQRKQNYKTWTNQQNQQYLRFILQNKQSFQSSQRRRSKKVFRGLSKILKGRTSHQCKSHHQKMQKMTKYGTIEEIREIIMQKLGKQEQKIKVSNKTAVVDQQDDQKEHPQQPFAINFNNTSQLGLFQVEIKLNIRLLQKIW